MRLTFEKLNDVLCKFLFCYLIQFWKDRKILGKYEAQMI